MVTCWEWAGLLARLYVKFSCVFVTFLCGVLSQVWYLIISIPDLCLFTYFYYSVVSGMIPCLIFYGFPDTLIVAITNK